MLRRVVTFWGRWLIDLHVEDFSATRPCGSKGIGGYNATDGGFVGVLAHLQICHLLIGRPNGHSSSYDFLNFQGSGYGLDALTEARP